MHRRGGPGAWDDRLGAGWCLDQAPGPERHGQLLSAARPVRDELRRALVWRAPLLLGLLVPLWRRLRVWLWTLCVCPQLVLPQRRPEAGPAPVHRARLFLRR